MNRNYLYYVGEACEKGMSPEEVQMLFKAIYRKSNDRKGKGILRMFAKGIGGAKREYSRIHANEINNENVNTLEGPGRVYTYTNDRY